MGTNKALPSLALSLLQAPQTSFALLECTELMSTSQSGVTTLSSIHSQRIFSNLSLSHHSAIRTPLNVTFPESPPGATLSYTKQLFHQALPLLVSCFSLPCIAVMDLVD